MKDKEKGKKGKEKKKDGREEGRTWVCPRISLSPSSHPCNQAWKRRNWKGRGCKERKNLWIAISLPFDFFLLHSLLLFFLQLFSHKKITVFKPTLNHNWLQIHFFFPFSVFPRTVSLLLYSQDSNNYRFSTDSAMTWICLLTNQLESREVKRRETITHLMVTFYTVIKTCLSSHLSSSLFSI